MQASAVAARLDTPSIRRVGNPPIWRIFAESKTRPYTIVVGNILAHEPPQMLLSQDDRVIGIRILPWRARSRDDVSQAC